MPFKSLKEDIFPILSNILKFVGEAFDKYTKHIKIFEGDGSVFYQV